VGAVKRTAPVALVVVVVMRVDQGPTNREEAFTTAGGLLL
jgi:hypothetical protein